MHNLKKWYDTYRFFVGLQANYSTVFLLNKLSLQSRSLTMDMKNANRPFRVSIEGNIGAGKSTLIKHFSQFPDVDIDMEPVNDWCNVQGHNLLELLYKDMKGSNFIFQNYVQLSRLKIQTHGTEKKVHIFERSLQNNRYCFVEMAYKTGQLSGPEYSVLCSWYDWIEKNFDIGLDLIVYLRSTPETVYERIQKRNRTEENTISLEYLQQLHEAYEEWLLKSDLPVSVLQIDANSELDEVQKLYVKHESDILGSSANRSHAASHCSEEIKLI